jgi:hypothetical protein
MDLFARVPAAAPVLRELHVNEGLTSGDRDALWRALAVVQQQLLDALLLPAATS